MNISDYSVYVDRLEAMSLREQGLIAVTVIGLIASIFQFFLIDPMLANEKSLSMKLNGMTANIARQKKQLEAIDPKLARQNVLSAEIKNLQAQISRKTETLDEYASSLIPAQKMPALLQSLLERKSVTLVALVNVPPVGLIEPRANDVQPANSVGSDDLAADGEQFQLYKHGIQIQLRGDFHTLRRYLLSIEEQPWKLLWQSMRFETEESGSSVMELHLQTLSTDSAWLGV